MTTEKHSKLPWDFDSSLAENGNGLYYASAVYNADGKVIFETSNSDDQELTREDEGKEWDEQGRRNTAFIVRACNSHYEMIKQLKFARAALLSAGYGQQSHTITKINEAIKQAEGA